MPRKRNFNTNKGLRLPDYLEREINTIAQREGRGRSETIRLLLGIGVGIIQCVSNVGKAPQVDAQLLEAWEENFPDGVMVGDRSGSW